MPLKYKQTPAAISPLCNAQCICKFTSLRTINSTSKNISFVMVTDYVLCETLLKLYT